jgi:hypothetical protein
MNASKAMGRSTEVPVPAKPVNTIGITFLVTSMKSSLRSVSRNLSMPHDVTSATTFDKGYSSLMSNPWPHPPQTPTHQEVASTVSRLLLSQLLTTAHDHIDCRQYAYSYYYVNRNALSGQDKSMAIVAPRSRMPNSIPTVGAKLPMLRAH